MKLFVIRNLFLLFWESNVLQPNKRREITGSYGIMWGMWNKCTTKLDRNSTGWIIKNPYILHLQNYSL